jgi:hypothetical protein
MEPNPLKSSHLKCHRSCQRVCSKKEVWNPVCSHRFCNLSVLKMRLFKDMKMEIPKVFSWDRCQLTIFKKLFSIKVISNLPKWDKKLKKINKFRTQQDICQACKINLRSVIQTKLNSSKHRKITSRWTVFNTFSTSASRLSWRKNMKREWSSWTIELKRDKRSKVHTKMHILFWCRTILETSTMLRIWPEVNLEASLK